MTANSNGKAEYNQVTKKVTITKGEVRLELPGEFDTLEEAKAAAQLFVERLRQAAASRSPHETHRSAT